MNVLKLLHLIGCMALLLESIFSLVNILTDTAIFGPVICIPLLVIGITGMICGLSFYKDQTINNTRS